MTKKILVIGLGKLGLPMATAYQEAGHYVWGYDIDSQASQKAREAGIGTVAIFDEEIQDLSSLSKVRAIDASLLIVPTPSRSNNMFDPSYVHEAIEKIAYALRGGSKYHLVVVKSTLMPGQMKEISEKLYTTSKRDERTLGVAYSPEFIALDDNIVRQMRDPNVVLIGAEDNESRERCLDLYHSVIDQEIRLYTKTTYHTMNFINAEIAKLALNVAITQKIAYANSIATLCESFVGGNVDKVLTLVGSDPRIGDKCLRAGTPFGGPCFPRDVRAMNALEELIDSLTFEGGKGTKLPSSAIEMLNEERYLELFSTLFNQLENTNSNKITILGLAYKSGSRFVDGSPARRIVDDLEREGVRVYGYDPRVTAFIGVDVKNDIDEAISASNVILVLNDERVFRRLPWHLYPQKTIVDPWRIVPAGPNVIQFGVAR